MSYSELTNESIVQQLNSSKGNKLYFDRIYAEYKNRLIHLYKLTEHEFVSNDMIDTLARTLVEEKINPNGLDMAMQHFRDMGTFPKSFKAIRDAAYKHKVIERKDNKSKEFNQRQATMKVEQEQFVKNKALMIEAYNKRGNGEELFAQKYKQWLEELWGDDYKACLNNTSVDPQIFQQCFVRDVVDAHGNIETALKIMHRKKARVNK